MARGRGFVSLGAIAAFFFPLASAMLESDVISSCDTGWCFASKFAFDYLHEPIDYSFTTDLTGQRCTPEYAANDTHAASYADCQAQCLAMPYGGANGCNAVTYVASSGTCSKYVLIDGTPISKQCESDGLNQDQGIYYARYAGTYFFTVNAPKAVEGLTLFIFDDQDSSWPNVYGQGLSNCDLFKGGPDGGPLYKAAESIEFTAAVAPLTGQTGNVAGRSDPIAIREAVRPRFWYFALGYDEEHCSNPPFQNVGWTIHTINDMSGSWEREFGVDQQGLNTLYIFYFFVYLIGIVVWGFGLRQLWRTGSIHPIIKILTSALVLQLVGLLCDTIHFGVYASDGYGVPPIHGLGEMLNVTSHILIILLLLLVAQGWTVTSETLQHKGALMGGMITLCVVYFILLIWSLAGVNPASTTYVYSSWPGILIVLCNIAACVWFSYTCLQSYKHIQIGAYDDESETSALAGGDFAEKAKLFKWLGIVYSVYFLVLPFIVILGTGVSAWVVAKTVFSTTLTLRTLWIAGLCYMFWPTKADKFFRISTRANAVTVSSTLPYEDIDQNL